MKVVGRQVFLPNGPEFVMKLVVEEMVSIVLDRRQARSERIEAQGYSF